LAVTQTQKNTEETSKSLARTRTTQKSK